MEKKKKEGATHAPAAGDDGGPAKTPEEAAGTVEEHPEAMQEQGQEDAELLKKVLQEKEETIRQLQERLLYQQADFENFKRIKTKESQDLLRYGNEKLIKELLPVIDNLERALEHATKTEDSRNIVEGVVLTLNGLLKVLEKAGVTRVEAVGKVFDPNFHEAIYQEERSDMEPGLVVAEMQKGYVMDGRLLRPSMVSVAKKLETK